MGEHSTDQDARFEVIRHFMTEQVPFNKVLGIELVSLGEGSATMVIPFRKELLGDPFRPAIHGGVVSALADVVGGTALLTQIKPGERLSTIDLRIDYLRPSGEETLTADAEVIRVGNRVGVVRIQVWSGEERHHVAEGTGVYQVKRLEP